MQYDHPLLIRASSTATNKPPTAQLIDIPSAKEDETDDELLNMHHNSRLEFFPEPEDESTGCRTCKTFGGSNNNRSVLTNFGPPRTVRANSNGSATFELGHGPLYDDVTHNSHNHHHHHDGVDYSDDLPLLQAENGTHVHNHHSEDTDHCHVNKSHSNPNRARNQLLISSGLCLVFMIAEILGGYFSNSLAIMTDAAHLLSDLGSFLISLFALWVGTRPPSQRMSFGYHRAEIIGAVLSVLIIWVLTGVLIYLAIKRVIDQDYEIQADTMLIVAGVGVLMNILMGFVLNSLCHCHTHSHGLGQSHDHSHSGSSQANINVRAAFIHVIGDLIQSIGVFIAAIIIKFKPEWHLADPICTFLFSVLVLFTTASIIRDAVHVLMEGFPKDLSYRTIKMDLQNIEGVKMAHSLHIWSLTIEKNALIVHLALEPNVNNHQILKNALNLVRQKYNIYHSTIQTEPYDPLVMTKCTQCLEPAS